MSEATAFRRVRPAAQQIVGATALLAAIFAPVAAFAVGGAPPGHSTVGECITNRIAFATTSLESGASLARPVLSVADATVQFTQGGSEPGCVIVHYSSEVRGSVPLRIRALLDGDGILNGTVGEPGAVTYAHRETIEEYSGEYRTQSFEFVFPQVTPGPHTIKIQWRGQPGQRLYFGKHTTTVHHRG
jgi:hypothetical protein